MAKWDKFRRKLMSGRSDSSLDFGDLCRFVEQELRFIPHPQNSGSHRVYAKAGISEIIDLQPNGHEAKAYQVRQVRSIIVTHSL